MESGRRISSIRFPSQSATCRWMMFSSSRTLPGQSYSDSASRADELIELTFFFICREYLARKYPASSVSYFVADVLDLPREWLDRFDLGVESLTVQSMPPEEHTAAAQNIAALVAPEGTLLVLATTRDESSEVKGPPWPLTRAELEEFANSDIILRRVERIEGGAWWRAELTRGGAGSTSPLSES